MRALCPNGHSYAEVGWTTRKQYDSEHRSCLECRTARLIRERGKYHRQGRGEARRYIDWVLVDRLAAGRSNERGTIHEYRAAMDRCLTNGLSIRETALRVGVCERTVERYSARRASA